MIRAPIDRRDAAIVQNVAQRAKNSFQPIQFVVADASRLRDGRRLTPSPGYHDILASNFNDPDGLQGQNAILR